jgi:hypothetical protein
VMRWGPSNQSDRTESPVKFSGKREYQLSGRENLCGRPPAPDRDWDASEFAQSQKAAKWRAFCKLEERTLRDQTGWLGTQSVSNWSPSDDPC